MAFLWGLGETDDHAGASGWSFDLSEDPSFWKDHNVQVIIRIRPLSSSEISVQGHSKCVKQESSQTITWTGHPESRFTFDAVADENVTQEKLFKVAGFPMVDNCMGGYNSCMFAYGQTGSGKTHTMLGDIEGGTRRHSVNCGMTPRVFEYLFSRIQKEKEARRDEKIQFSCKCSFLEIYNEQILDLLDPSTTNLQIREDTKKGIYVENLKETEVTSAREVIQQLVQGAANRKVAATNMNRASSRSHSVFTCSIESNWEAQGVNHHRFARLNLVDLAGSERQKSSGAEGDRLKEATNINKSLSTLGLVIMNLVNISNGKSQHVPYRDSKLTFLLQDSLGGNSKTTIIANISPAKLCSLETLSTLKFAQRAKYIKNNAIVNEDASGDVIAMRMQIQQLKKEVSRLQGIVEGESGNQENDMCAVSFPGSPGFYKWEGLLGSFSPLTIDKRNPHVYKKEKDYDAVLVGALKRERDKEIALQALAAENQAAMQLAKQREDEIQGLKMRLRLREAGMKRLETVACGKISGETHLLKEREEHLKEIEVLRSQVDRNQEVTRFAMENLRLKEEIRRLKSFYEDGEQEVLTQQISMLQNKLLEALDWKLMHETDPSVVKKENLDTAVDVQGNGDLLTCGQQPASPWRSSINEENEFLCLQAIQNQAEMDVLRKKLNLCLEEKEKLERNVTDLVSELEKARLFRENKEETKRLQIEPPSQVGDEPTIESNDQIELKTMVDAIAVVSQREAEAHGIAINLSKENDELRMKLKVLIEDNNKLIELYEGAVAEAKNLNSNRAEKVTENNNKDDFTDIGEGKEEIELKKVVENLEQQLMEMHEENDKLLGLYENAMQERDGLKRMIALGVHLQGDLNCPEKLVEVDGGECFRSYEPQVSSEVENMTLVVESSSLPLNHQENEENPIDLSGKQTGECSRSSEPQISGEVENMMDERFSSLTLLDESSSLPLKYQENEENSIDLSGRQTAFATGNYFNEMKPSDEGTVKLLEDMDLAKLKLERAQEKLSHSVKATTMFGTLEKAICEVEKLSCEIEALNGGIQMKQQEFETFKLVSSEMRERRSLVNKKLLALKYSLSSSTSSIDYFEQREATARARANAALAYLDGKKEELDRLQAHKDKIGEAKRTIQRSEVELRNKLSSFKSRLDEEKIIQENARVLFAIDNVEKSVVLPSKRDGHLGCKATDLLKSEEDETRLQAEISKSREKLETIKREHRDVNTKHVKVEGEIRVVEMEIQNGMKAVDQMEAALRGCRQEKDMVLEFSASGKAEVERMILEYLQSVFEADLKDEEMRILEEEMQMESKRVVDLCSQRVAVNERKNQLLEETRRGSHFLSEKLEEELRNVQMQIVEAKSLLQTHSGTDI